MNDSIEFIINFYVSKELTFHSLVCCLCALSTVQWSTSASFSLITWNKNIAIQLMFLASNNIFYVLLWTKHLMSKYNLHVWNTFNISKYIRYQNTYDIKIHTISKFIRYQSTYDIKIYTISKYRTICDIIYPFREGWHTIVGLEI